VLFRSNKSKDPPLLNASLLLLCGLPSSGKSSMASLLMQQVDRTDENICFRCSEILKPDSLSYDEAYLIDYDDITENVLTEFVKTEQKEAPSRDKVTNTDHYFDDLHLKAWRETRNLARERLFDLLSPPHHCDKRKFCSRCLKDSPWRILIILDDNFHLRSMRRDIYKQCQSIVANFQTSDAPDTVSHNYTSGSSVSVIIGFSVLVLDTDPNVCKERNSKRKGRSRVPEDVMNNMISTIELPNGDESSLQIPSTTQQTDIMHLINSLLLSGLNNPILPLSDGKGAVTDQKENRLHSIDRLLRYLVSLFCNIDKSFAQRANNARKMILNECRAQQKESRRKTGQGSFQDSALPENQEIFARFVEAALADNCNCLSPGDVNKILQLQNSMATSGLLFIS